MIGIPFNKPTLVGTEYEYLKQCFEYEHISGVGLFTKKCEALLEKRYGFSKAFLTTSCTHALEMTALLINLLPGDEVILPSFTFPSVANAYVLRGARPIFADIRRDTLNLDETQIERHITSRTKAIVVVHYGGVACEMDRIAEIAAQHNLTIIEDNAHGLFGKYKNKPLGTFGCLATLSFHETKNISCGEGGALLINNPKYVQRAEFIREKGTNRSSFFRGEIDKYSWVDVGSSYVLSDILAAYLYANLEVAANIQARRRKLWLNYQTGLRAWAEENFVRLPIVPGECEQAYHLFYMLLPSLDERNRLIQYLKEHKIHSIFHYQPLHTSKMGYKLGWRAGDCPVSETVSNCILRLPFYNSLSDDEQNYVIQKILEYKVEKRLSFAFGDQYEFVE
jgi:dTDP-4-amino-4,6-dideoxygalactose transaminase